MDESETTPFAEPGDAGRGARFFRADLHVHSYGASRDVTDMQMTPARIVEQANARGIALLAVTDHNAIDAVETAIVAGREHGVFVLAGVELTGADGHLLAYFDPDRLEDFRRWFARLDFAEDDATGDRWLLKPLHALAHEIAAAGGVAIPAHVGRTGTGCLVKAPRKSQDALIASPAVSAIEVDGPEQFAWFTAHDDGDGSAVRREQLAARVRELGDLAGPRLPKLYFSDAHTLDMIGRGRGGGERLTRIKMSSPSFPAFVRALQDPDARIRLEDELPQSYPRIVGARFIGGFLDGQEIAFSPNLTCLIGGRGTGKSTALEAVRAACLSLTHKREVDEDAEWPDSVQLVFQDAFGARHFLERQVAGETLALVDGAAVPMTASVEGYNQDRIAEIIREYPDNPDPLTAFLDGFSETSDVEAAILETRADLEANAASLAPLADAGPRKENATRLLGEAEAKLKAVEASKLKDALAFRRLVTTEQSLRVAIEQRVAAIRAAIAALGVTIDIDQLVTDAGIDDPGNTPGHAHLVGTTDDPGLIELSTRLEESLSQWKIEGEARVRAVTPAINAKIADWSDFEARVERRIQAIFETLRSEGIKANESEMNRLAQQEAAAKEAIRRADADLTAERALNGERADLLRRYRQQQEARFQRRRVSTSRLTDLLNASLQEFKVKIAFSEAARVDTYEAWLKATLGLRAFRAERLTAFCRAIHPVDLADAVRRKRSANLMALTDVRGGRYFASEGDVLDFCGLFKTPDLHELETIARSDLPRISLTVLGAGQPQVVPFERLSLGQKASILLSALLFSDDDAPLIIDQPEDHLDSAFVSQTVVGTLRNRKERRQIILATHNANIAILGDAEMIVPLVSYDGRGLVRDAGSVDAISTSERACRVLEGGKAAYLRRGEMYGLS